MLVSISMFARVRNLFIELFYNLEAILMMEFQDGRQIIRKSKITTKMYILFILVILFFIIVINTLICIISVSINIVIICDHDH